MPYSRTPSEDPIRIEVESCGLRSGGESTRASDGGPQIPQLRLIVPQVKPRGTSLFFSCGNDFPGLREKCPSSRFVCSQLRFHLIPWQNHLSNNCQIPRYGSQALTLRRFPELLRSLEVLKKLQSPDIAESNPRAVEMYNSNSGYGLHCTIPRFALRSCPGGSDPGCDPALRQDHAGDAKPIL